MQIGLLALNIIVLLCLSGCSRANPSEYYYLTHPAQLEKKLALCAKAPKQGMHDPVCKTASRAYEKMQNLQIHAQQFPQQFGETIIQTQLKIAQMKQQIHHMKSQQSNTKKLTKLQQKLKQLQQQYHIYMKIIAMQGV